MSAMAASDEAAIAQPPPSSTRRRPRSRPSPGISPGQMARGLVGEPSSLKMLRTFTRQPSGRERGRVVVVDWGGTKARAGLIELGGEGSVRMVAEEALIFSEADKRGAPEPVFDLIAERSGAWPRRRAVEAAPLGFYSYSYPARLERIDRAVALASTKGWRLKGLEGQDVWALLGAALRRAGLERVALAAVANDTVAALMLQSYRARGRDAGARPADVGLILGTGTNQAAQVGPAGIRNLESGNFDGVGAVETPYDAALDRELDEPRPGAQRFEKRSRALSGRDPAPRAGGPGPAHHPVSLVGLARARHPARPRQRALLAHRRRSHPGARRRGRAAPCGAAPRARWRERRGRSGALGAAITCRAARLVGAALVGTLRFLDAELADRRTIAVDLSLFGRLPGLRGARAGDHCRATWRGTCASRIEAVYVKDSTSAGAAVIAAAAA